MLRKKPTTREWLAIIGYGPCIALVRTSATHSSIVLCVANVNDILLNHLFFSFFIAFSQKVHLLADPGGGQLREGCTVLPGDRRTKTNWR